MSDVNTRLYNSPLRQEGARATRRAILSAAGALFVAQGYVGTTIDQIAAGAGVSKPTVFTACGSKRTILKLLRDYALAGDDEPVSVPDRSWFQAMLAAPDPWQQLRLYAAGNTQMVARYAEIEEVLHAAAGADEELAELWRTNEDERLAAAAGLVDRLITKGPLREGLTRDAARDILWVLMGGDNYRRLVIQRDWSPAAYERWLGDMFCEQLLGQQQRSL